MHRKILILAASSLMVAVGLAGCGGGDGSSKDATACQIWQSVGAWQTPGTVAIERLDDMATATGGQIESRAETRKQLIQDQASPQAQLDATEALNQVCRSFVDIPTTPAPSGG